MRVVLVGDQHFGAGYGFGKIDTETGLNTRLLDYEKTLSNIIDYIIAQKIELCIMLGDIFENRNPPPHQVVVFYRQLKRLAIAGITTLLMPGNHDISKNRKITSSLDPLKELSLANTHVFNDIDLYTFTDSYGESLNVIMMPYRNRQSYDRNTNDEAVNDMGNEVFVAKTKAKKDAPLLLAGHMMLEGTISSDIGEYGINELILPFDIFAGIDVVINGHIHRASILKENPVFIYSGSMECRDFSEKEHQKCFLVYDTSKTGIEAITFKAITTRRFVDFDIDYTTFYPESPMNDIMCRIDNANIKDCVVKVIIRVPETKVSNIDTGVIRSKLYEIGVNCIAEVSVVPIILKQLRNQKVNEATDDRSAFKHYVMAQSNVDNDVLEKGLSIINIELDR